MNAEKSFFFILLIGISFSVAANARKAKVITESGKKWDVLFLKMSVDTIYLKARKSDGTVFSISGHKSKFRKVEFADGSYLDFSLSDYPPKESPNRVKEGNGAIAVRDSVFSTMPFSPQQQKDTVSLTNKSNGQEIFAIAPVPSQLPAEIKTDTVVNTMNLDTSMHGQGLEKFPQKSVLDSAGMLTIETKPADALIEIDGRAMEGTSPLIAKHLLKGEHIVLARKDSLQASKNVKIENGGMQHIFLALEKMESKQAAIKKKGGRGWGIFFSMLSIASAGGGGGMYYLYRKDHKKELQTYDILSNSKVKGANVDALILENKNKHEHAQTKLIVSEILFGVGVACLGTGLVFYF